MTGRLRVVTTLALELVARGVDGTTAEYVEARPLVEWACQKYRAVAPTESERLFHFAAVALQQGARDDQFGPAHRDGTRANHLLHALERFPQDSRLRLAYVTLGRPAHLLSGWPVSPGFLVSAGAIDPEPPEAAKSLQAADDMLSVLVDDPQVGDEATLRRGALRYMRGQFETARPDLEVAAKSREDFVRYLGSLMLGLTLERTGREAEAVPYYAAAFRVLPATAAAVALSAALARQGRSAEAAPVIEEWSGADRADDPWRLYSFRDYRLFPSYLSRLRAMVRQ